VEDKTGYRFRDWDLLNQALTHKSYANEVLKETDKHYERIEFLGDAILDAVVSDLLMIKYPSANEGELSKRRSSLVNTKRLAQFARTFNLGSYILLGKGEEQTLGRNKNSILSCVYEAFIGAVYLDSGFEKSYAVIRRHFEPHITGKVKKYGYRDFKSRLQEHVQGQFKTIPEYTIIGESGPAHEKEFEVTISINGKAYGSGKGKNKKEAEQKAASKALKELGAG
jgi:ribonuclease III